MDKHEKHQEHDAWEEQEVAFFRKVDVPLGEEKNVIWEELAEKMTPKEPTKVRSIWIKSIAAAVVVMVFSSIVFCKYHTITIYSQNGEHLAHEFPDGSTVELNAASSIAYAPYWWSYDRAVKMEGEAYFEVKKGSSFVVYSSKGKTEVLGTSFNIFAREGEYRVLCTTGRVKVTSQPYETEMAFALSPTEMAVINKDGKFTKEINVPIIRVTGWRENKFHFDGMPLKDVLKNLERQYDVAIEMQDDQGLYYTGVFDKSETVEESLEIISAVFDLKYRRVDNQSYILKKK